jgi:exopolysaccharide biosynthesis polyprenyl glycosylphosphotransferase
MLLLLGRTLYLLIFARGRFRRKVLILGAGWAGQTIFQALIEHAQTVYRVAGFIDDNPEKVGQSVQIHKNDSGQLLEEPTSAKVLGSSQDILRIIGQRHINTLVLAITWDVGGKLYQVLTDCLQLEVEVIPMPLLYEQLTGKVPVEHIGDHWSISMPLEQPGTKIAWHALKRLFDLFWSSLGMIFLILAFPFIALAIKLETKGPVLYTQERMGRNGKVFRVYKFRSMVEDAETDQAVWAQKDDPRITRVGKVLRKTHLDEFPQFWNILKGEMSVVGPRPERPEFITELAQEIPFYRVRLAAKPGMAGWGLIHQGYSASKEDALEKLQYDLYYIKHQSLWLDLYILWRTVIDSLSLGGR